MPLCFDGLVVKTNFWFPSPSILKMWTYMFNTLLLLIGHAGAKLAYTPYTWDAPRLACEASQGPCWPGSMCALGPQTTKWHRLPTPTRKIFQQWFLCMHVYVMYLGYESLWWVHFAFSCVYFVHDAGWCLRVPLAAFWLLSRFARRTIGWKP